MMILINPMNFAEMKIDETLLTDDQQEIFKRMSKRTKRINDLQAKQFMDMFKMEAITKMRFRDVINKVKI